MEKRKLLLVAISVGVVLLIIIGIPLLVITPGHNFESASPVAWSTEPDHRWIKPADPVVVHEMRELPPAEVYEIASQFPAEISPVEAAHVTTFTVTLPETTTISNTSVTQSQKPSAARSAPVANPVPAKTVPIAHSVPAASSAPAKSVPAPKETDPLTVAAAKPAEKSAARTPAAEPARTRNDYWVQTGAFSTKIRAEGVKESLASKGITSIIDNRDIEGKTLYRVRVGPYTSEKEASYWLALVKSIDGFSDSQIRQTLR